MTKLTISQKEFEATISLGCEKRYRYFIKRVADSQKAWSLWDGERWFIYEAPDGRRFFPIWPAKEYGDACATGDWEKATSSPINVERLIGEFLPTMSADGISPAVFPLPSGDAIEISAEGLKNDLEAELAKY